MTEADFITGVGFRPEREAARRAVGEVVGRRCAIRGRGFGVQGELLAQAAGIRELPGRLAGEVSEGVATYGGAEAVGHGRTPVGAGPGAEALHGVLPIGRTSGQRLLVVARVLIAHAEPEGQVAPRLPFGEGGELVAVEIELLIIEIRPVEGVGAIDIARRGRTGVRPEGHGAERIGGVADPGREHPAAILLPIVRIAARGMAVRRLPRQAGIPAVDRADHVEDEVRRQAPVGLEQPGRRIARAIRPPTVVMRSGQREGRALRRGDAGRGVIGQIAQAERGPTEGTSLKAEGATGLVSQRIRQAQVDDSAEGVGAVEGRRRAAHDLDRRKAEKAVAPDLVRIGEPLRQATTVEQHGRLRGIGAADQQRADRTFARLFGGVDPGSVAEQAGEGRLSGFRRLRDIQAADRRRGLGKGRGLPSFDHDRLGQAGRRLGQEERKKSDHAWTIPRGLLRST